MDHEELVMYRIASLRSQGEDAQPRIIWKRSPSGIAMYRLQIRRGDKSIEDLPSPDAPHRILVDGPTMRIRALRILAFAHRLLLSDLDKAHKYELQALEHEQNFETGLRGYNT